MKNFTIGGSFTNRAELDRYISEIKKFKPLSKEEEYQNLNNRDKLIKHNLLFVLSVAKQFQNQGLGLADLVNEGNLGLITAIEKFDPSRNLKLISYAVWWIRQSIELAIAEKGRNIRLPSNVITGSKKIKKEIDSSKKRNLDFSDSELSSLLSIDIDKISDFLNVSYKESSLDDVLGENLTVIETVGNIKEEINEFNSISKDIDIVLKSIDSRSRKIIKMYYGINCKELSLQEIAKDLGLNIETIRMSIKKSLRKLKSPAKKLALNEYL